MPRNRREHGPFGIGLFEPLGEFEASRAWLILAEQHSKKRETETLTTATEPSMTK